MIEQETLAGTTPQARRGSRTWIGAGMIGLTGFFFVLLQSACAAVMAISGLRLLIGIGSLAAASTGVKLLVAIHGDALRIPMLALAVGGSLVNLYVIWRIRSLRARPSSQWRTGPAAPARKRAESFQIALAVLTLLLVALEWVLHIYLHGAV